MATKDVESELVSMAGHLAAGHCRQLHEPLDPDPILYWLVPELRAAADAAAA